MRPFAVITASLLVLSLTACGGAEDAAPSVTQEADMPMDTAGDGAMDHGNHEMGESADGVGHATGTIRSVGVQGDMLTINHGPFHGGIKMDAMTMGFGIMGGVDLSGLTEGDEVAFMVKQGRDGSYRIMAICNTAANGADCLDGMMKH